MTVLPQVDMILPGHCDSLEACTYWLSQFYELKACGFYVICQNVRRKGSISGLSCSIVIAYINKFSDFHSMPEWLNPT
jgi:hypothetical protein